ncbi:MAG: iron ABC transporter permease [Coriobacteriales bacterium]|nr:iron ABC transporter permease [Coriobacteriales bacterium]
MNQISEQTAEKVSQARATYLGANKKKYIVIAVLAVLVFVSLIIDVLTGAAMLTPQEVLSTLFNPGGASAGTYVIIWQMRLPIALMAIAVGCALGSAGSVMQTILHNPLASPYTLGIGAAAGFGASLAIVMGLGNTGSAVLSFVFSMSICMLIWAMNRKSDISGGTLVLTGIALLFLFQALQALVQYGASETQNQNIVFWSFGSLQKTDWIKLAITSGIVAVCLPLIMRDSWKYTALMLGDEKAEGLGVKVGPLKMRAFVLVSLLAASAVCFTGSIGFIGLAGPHIARTLVGEDQRFYIPVSTICGAALLSIASIISKLIRPGLIFPIGIITSIIGVPFFFAIVARARRGGK